jgi:hypothetical protein
VAPPWARFSRVSVSGFVESGRFRFVVCEALGRAQGKGWPEIDRAAESLGRPEADGRRDCGAGDPLLESNDGLRCEVSGSGMESLGRRPTESALHGARQRPGPRHVARRPLRLSLDPRRVTRGPWTTRHRFAASTVVQVSINKPHDAILARLRPRAGGFLSPRAVTHFGPTRQIGLAGVPTMNEKRPAGRSGADRKWRLDRGRPSRLAGRTDLRHLDRRLDASGLSHRGQAARSCLPDATCQRWTLDGAG